MRAVPFSLCHRPLPYILRSQAKSRIDVFDSDPFDIANLAKNLEFHKGECLGVRTAQVRRLANGSGAQPRAARVILWLTRNRYAPLGGLQRLVSRPRSPTCPGPLRASAADAVITHRRVAEAVARLQHSPRAC
jgi:hypothetical protein